MDNFLLVFVCTGNICRSPLAEGIMKDIVLDEVDIHHQVFPIEITSAGTHAIEGHPASQYAVDVAALSGINLNYHRSKYITEGLVKHADLILTMERSHTQYIKSLWPYFDSIFELKCFGLEEKSVPPSIEIPDPIGMDIDFYKDVFDELKKEINRISPIVFSMVNKKSGN